MAVGYRTLTAPAVALANVDALRAIDDTPTWLGFGGTGGHVVLADLKYGVAPPTNFALGAQVSAVWDQELSLVQLGWESAAEAAKKTTTQVNAILSRRE